MAVFATVTALPVVERDLVIVVDQANPENMIISEDNTINATMPAPGASFDPNYKKSGKLPLALVNKFGNGTVNGYMTGTDRAGHLVMLQPDGTFFVCSSISETPRGSVSATS